MIVDGEVLTENTAILSYIADLNPEAGLSAQSGLEKYRVLEGLSWVGAEFHKSFGPLFNPVCSGCWMGKGNQATMD